MRRYQNGWSTNNGQYWLAEASTLGDPNRALLPNGHPIANVLWTAEYNRDGDLDKWVGVDKYNTHYTIFND